MPPSSLGSRRFYFWWLSELVTCRRVVRCTSTPWSRCVTNSRTCPADGNEIGSRQSDGAVLNEQHPSEDSVLNAMANLGRHNIGHSADLADSSASAPRR